MGSTTDIEEWLDQFPEGLDTNEKADLSRVINGSASSGSFAAQPTRDGKGIVISNSIVENDLVLPTEKSKNFFNKTLQEGSDFGDPEFEEYFLKQMAKDD